METSKKSRNEICKKMQKLKTVVELLIKKPKKARSQKRTIAKIIYLNTRRHEENSETHFKQKGKLISEVKKSQLRIKIYTNRIEKKTKKQPKYTAIQPPKQEITCRTIEKVNRQSSAVHQLQSSSSRVPVGIDRPPWETRDVTSCPLYDDRLIISF